MAEAAAAHRIRGRQPLLFLLLLLLVVLFVSRRVSDTDTWWLLAGGELVLNEGIPHTNSFSHTFTEHPWKFTQWLFAAVIALAERAGGLAAVEGVQVLFAALTFLTVAATSRLRSERLSWPLFLPLFVAGLYASSWRFVPRGHLATLLGLALLHFFWTKRPRGMPLYFLTAGILWSNLHAGVVFGLALTGLMGAAALLERNGKDLLQSLKCGLAFAVGSLGNPYLAEPYIYVYENLAFTKDFPVQIAELMPPVWSQFPEFYILAFIGVLSFVPALRSRNVLHVLSGIAFLVLAMKVRRFIPYFVILTLPGIYGEMARFAAKLSRRMQLLLLPVLGAIVIAAAGFLAFRNPGFNPSPSWFKWGGDLSRQPAGASSYIRGRSLSGKIFNEFDQGGFLIWSLYPGQKVFIDGRGSAYPLSFFKESAHYQMSSLQRILDQYRIDLAVVQRRPFSGQVDMGSMFDRLGWHLVFVEGNAYVFVRPGSGDAARTRQDVFAILKPWMPAAAIHEQARSAKARALAELRRVPPETLSNRNDLHVFGAAAYFAGDVGLASSYFNVGLSRYPKASQMRQDYATILASLGRREEYREHLELIISLSPESDEAVGAKEKLRALGQGGGGR